MREEHAAVMLERIIGTSAHPAVFSSNFIFIDSIRPVVSDSAMIAWFHELLSSFSF
jgi:hypothetical protein